MQVFHYNYIIGKHGDKAEMLLAYTDFWCIKMKLKMFMKSFTKINSYLTSVNTQKIQILQQWK